MSDLPEGWPKGRPKHYNPLGKRFRSLYVDPFLQPSDVCRALGISRATYYRYERELNLPTVRVGMAVHSALPTTSRIWRPKLESERIDLAFIERLSAQLPARIRLARVALEGSEKVRALRERKIDVLFGGLARTKERAEEFAFSLPYDPNLSPYGQLITLRGLGIGERGGQRPRLGVLVGSVHAEHADKELASELEIVSKPSVRQLIDGLASRRLDAILHFSEWAEEAARERGVRIEAHPKRFTYDSFTGMLFQRDSAMWKPAFDTAIERVLSTPRSTLVET